MIKRQKTNNITNTEHRTNTNLDKTGVAYKVSGKVSISSLRSGTHRGTNSPTFSK